MKREALNHPKMLDLASRLDCSLATAIGHVTLLINWVADFAICGDVGKWPDGAIARGCGFTVADTTVATTVVTAFVDAGWLDRHDEHRLILHDWPDHAERWVRAKLAATNQSFLACYSETTKSDATVDTTVDTVVSTPPRDRTEPNQTFTSDVDADADDFEIEEPESAKPELIEACNRISRIIGVSKSPKQNHLDRQLIFKTVVIARRKLSEKFLDDALGDAEKKIKAGGVRNPRSLFHAICQAAASDRGKDFNRLMKRVVVPSWVSENGKHHANA